MAEEQRWQPPEGHRLCANNCGFFGSPTTRNLCSKCYKDKFAHLAMEAKLRHLDPLIPPHPPPSEDAPLPAAPPATQGVEPSSSGPGSPNRCGACGKRLGVVGFACKCGAIFCGSHRYPEKHGCGFDYKAVGRAAIARANPVVKGKKLDKI